MRSFFKKDYHMLVNGREMNEAVKMAHAPSWEFADLSNALYGEDISESTRETDLAFHKELLRLSEETLEWCMETVRCHALLDELKKNPLGRILINKALKNLET